MKPFGSFRIQVCLLLSVCLLLCACSSGETDTLSATSSPPDTKAERLLEAVAKGEQMLLQMEETFGAPVFSALETLGGDGKAQEKRTVDAFSAMGISIIGSSPLELNVSGAHVGNVTHQAGTLAVEGDVIPFESIAVREQLYLSLPQVANGNFSLDPESAGLFPTVDGGAADKLTEAFRSLLAEDQITVTHRDGGTEYTVTLGEAAWSKLQKAMDDCGLTAFLATELAPDTQGATTYFTLAVFAADHTFSLKTVLQSGDQRLLQSSFTLEKQGKVLSLAGELLRDGQSLVRASGSLTAEKGRMTLAGSFASPDVLLEPELTLTAEDGKSVSVTGRMDATLPYRGVTLSVPLYLTGTLSAEGEALAYTYGLEASVSGMLELAMSGEGVFTPGTPAIPEVFDGKELRSVDLHGLVDSLRGTYPDAAGLYDALFPGEDAPTEDITSVTYRDEDGSLVLSLFSDGTVGLSLQGSFAMEDGTLSLAYGEHLLFDVPYTANENNTYTIWGATFTYYADSTMDTYTYLSPDGTCWIELMPILSAHGLALLDLCLPGAVTEGALELEMPDGSILSIPCLADEDDLSMILWDVPLKFAAGD